MAQLAQEDQLGSVIYALVICWNAEVRKGDGRVMPIADMGGTGPT